ncbi:RNA-directed DNA polymerase, eukaryota, reverse transcriptase zinc-binding domain protein [Tanacetum coccineum]
MESLHLSFQRVVDAGLFTGMKFNSSTSLSHLFYADDAIFVGQWSDVNIDTLVKVLDCFFRASGLRINMCKSKLMGVNVEDGSVSNAAAKIGCLVLKIPFIYLGTKVGDCMSTKHAWKEVVDKVVTRLSRWKMKTLSIGGRLTLLKSVLGSIPIFHMSIYKVPVCILNSLESIRSHFFNGHDLNSKKSSWVKWSNVLTPKEKGGLGVSSLYALNRSLMLKWVWRFISQKPSLWSNVIKAIHGDDGSLEKGNGGGYRSSWISIIQELKILQDKGINMFEFMRLNLGNGEGTRFWKDKWFDGGTMKVLFPRLYALEMDKMMTVSVKMNANGLDQSFCRKPGSRVEESQYNAMVDISQNIQLKPCDDRYVWSLNNSGEFSVASLRKVIDDNRFHKVNSSTRWVNLVPIKVNVIAWKVMSNALPTRFNISSRGMDIDTMECPICKEGSETSSHLFFQCRVVRQLTRKISTWWNVDHEDVNSYEEWRCWLVSLRIHSKTKGIYSFLCIFDNLSPLVSLKMFEEDQNMEVVLPVKSDMHSYSSTMTAKDVKALAFKHNIPLDLHLVALTAKWTMDKLTDNFIVSTYRVDSADPVRVILSESTHCPFGELVPWWKKRFFFLDRRAIPQAMAWRHHDSDIHDPLPTDGFRASDVVTLTNQSIDIRPVPSGLLFHAGLATTWEFSGFLPSFKDTEGNVVTMSEYLRFPFLDGATIEQGDALSARDAITSHTTGPLPVNQSLPEKTARLKEVEIPDPKIVAIRERKARAAAKKRAERKRAAGGGILLRRLFRVLFETVAPNPYFLLKDVDDAGTAESRGDEHVSVPYHDSANTTHDHTVDHDESFGESRGHGETVETHPADETRLTESPVPARNPEKTAVQNLVPVVRSNLAGDMPMELSLPVLVLFYYRNGPSPKEEMNAYDNSTAMERAWFSIARGAMAQTDALLRFEALYDAHLALKERCEDISAGPRRRHAVCDEKLYNAERERDELRAVNAVQVYSKIKELEAGNLLGKDSALVFSDRVSNERAVENERLVSKLGYFEKEKNDSIGKLLPIVVRRLLNNHEYKESLSIPVNFAFQAVGQKDFGLPRQTVPGAPKDVSCSPPQDVSTKVNPSSQAPDSSKSVPKGANV